MPERIPLFPLNVVLFPDGSLPLHIFEPRYKLMVQDCLSKPQEFGVVLARPEGIVAVGCTAAILQVARKYPDGRLDIVTQGRWRYRILELLEEKPYYEARVDYIAEGRSSSATETKKALREAYARCCDVLYGQASELAAEPGALLAYHMASELPLELEQKQALLELDNEDEREQQLLAHLKEWLPQLVRRKAAQAKARGNGYGAK